MIFNLVRKILKIFIVEIKKFEKFNVELYYHTDHLPYAICKKKKKEKNDICIHFYLHKPQNAWYI